jgi:hypothetical protein
VCRRNQPGQLESAWAHDRFIPTREPGVNLQAAYQLMPDVDPLTGRELPKKGKRKSGPGTDQDVRKGE